MLDLILLNSSSGIPQLCVRWPCVACADVAKIILDLSLQGSGSHADKALVPFGKTARFNCGGIGTLPFANEGSDYNFEIL